MHLDKSVLLWQERVLIERVKLILNFVLPKYQRTPLICGVSTGTNLLQVLKQKVRKDASIDK